MERNKNVYEIINLGENEVINLNEMLSTLEENLDKKAHKNHLPTQPGDMPKTNADVQKAKNLIGYHPTIRFQNGIKKFVEWFLRNAT